MLKTPCKGDPGQEPHRHPGQAVPRGPVRRQPEGRARRCVQASEEGIREIFRHHHRSPGELPGPQDTPDWTPVGPRGALTQSPHHGRGPWGPWGPIRETSGGVGTYFWKGSCQ